MHHALHGHLAAGRPDGTRSTLWLSLTLALAAAMLLCFGAVVTAGTRAGAERRIEQAARDDAHWRCIAAKSRPQRLECLAAHESTRMAAQGVDR